MALSRAFGAVCPSLIIAAGISSLRSSFQYKLIPMQTSSENEIFQGVVQTVFHRIHLLLSHCYVKNRLFTILMNKGQAIGSSDDAVTLSGETLGG